MSALAKNYNRRKISFKKGKGSFLYSTERKKYLDFVQGIAVNSLGHCNPNLIKASRKIRISNGSGTRVQDVNKLLKQFFQSQKMMKKMKSMGKGSSPEDLMQKLQGRLPPNFN